MTLPKWKIMKICDILQLCLWKTKLTKWELQSLIGKLNFACRVIYGGHTCLRWIIDFCNKLVKPNHLIRLNSHVKAELYWWINYVETFNGFTKIIDQSLLPQHVFSIDACPTGGEAQFGCDWFYLNSWEADFPYFSNLHINKLEVFTVYLAIQRWKEFKNKWIVIYVDNSCTLTWISKGTANALRVVMLWLRDIFWFSAISNFRITARYINTSDNVNSDTISCLVDPKYAQGFFALIASGQILISNSIVSNNTLSMLPLQIKSKLKNPSQTFSLYRNATFAASTSHTYKCQLRAYLCFCLYFGYTIIPASSCTILRCIIFLANSLAPQSIPNFLNIIHIIHLQAGYKNPLEDDFLHFSYHQLLRGIKHLIGCKVKQKLHPKSQYVYTVNSTCLSQ